MAGGPILRAATMRGGSDGRLKPLRRTAGAENPFFLALSPDKKFLYSIHAKQFGGKENEQVAAYEVVGRSGELKLLNRQSAEGRAACYLDVDRTGKCVLVANYTSGSVAGYSVTADGMIVARYTNGQTRPQGQVILANFKDPGGLVQLGSNKWVETKASGQPLPGPPGTSDLGVIQAGALEESNVDLTAALVAMITAQRVYQANAQTIKSQDEVLQTMLNMK